MESENIKLLKIQRHPSNITDYRPSL